MYQITINDLLIQKDARTWKPIPDDATVFLNGTRVPIVKVIDENWKRAELIDGIRCGEIDGQPVEIGFRNCYFGSCRYDCIVPIVYRPRTVPAGMSIPREEKTK